MQSRWNMASYRGPLEMVRLVLYVLIVFLGNSNHHGIDKPPARIIQINVAQMPPKKPLTYEVFIIMDSSILHVDRLPSGSRRPLPKSEKLRIPRI